MKTNNPSDEAYKALQAIYLDWHGRHRPLSGYISALLAWNRQQVAAKDEMLDAAYLKGVADGKAALALERNDEAGELIKILGLERDLHDQLVLSNYEDVQSDWTFVVEKLLAWNRRQVVAASRVTGETSDGYHTFNELYEFRKLYNAALFNEWAVQKKYKVHKSWHHADAPYDSIFAKGWFVVVAELPTGQISNHYPPEDWDLFHIPEVRVAHAYDDHTSQDVVERLDSFLRSTTDSEAGK